MSTVNYLKGSNFINRYKIVGHLITETPLHIGSGGVTNRPGLTKKENEKEPVDISEVALDLQEKPCLPGSTLRGNIRSWLLQILRCVPKSWPESNETLAWEHDFENLVHYERYQQQGEQINFMKNSASVLERLFGTAFSASKIDVWDAPCITSGNQLTVPPELSHANQPPYWSSQRLTYVTQSVAIDPNTGAAADQKLYHFEVIPKGVMFKVTLVGQNLTDLELGMLLFGLEAFDSQIFPVTLGAMSNRGFGHFKWNLQEIYRLDLSNMRDWLKEAISANSAGYASLKPLGASKEALINNFKETFKNALEVQYEG